MADHDILWSSELTALGHRVDAVSQGDGGMTLTLSHTQVKTIDRRPATLRNIRSRLVVAPTSLDELIRVAGHGCDYYDAELRPRLGTLAQKHASLPGFLDESVVPRS